ncbi:hypothetical protein MUK42_09221 [Musa troglodytarum]|uniref:Uncharacterized protein n=1 Tax=Musa troglodytarum TaxID=320322 RepID=A0A9E7EGE9_9LILI|nr:hypothetical protein MUK42_09221 [Musa troglodytarum]
MLQLLFAVALSAAPLRRLSPFVEALEALVREAAASSSSAYLQTKMAGWSSTKQSMLKQNCKPGSSRKPQALALTNSIEPKSMKAVQSCPAAWRRRRAVLLSTPPLRRTATLRRLPGIEHPRYGSRSTAPEETLGRCGACPEGGGGGNVRTGREEEVEEDEDGEEARDIEEARGDTKNA